MSTLSPSQISKLRGLIARALDSASSDAEANSSARAACRLLAAEGLGVDGDPEAEVSIGRCAGTAARGFVPMPDYVVRASYAAYPTSPQPKVGCPCWPGDFGRGRS